MRDNNVKAGEIRKVWSSKRYGVFNSIFLILYIRFPRRRFFSPQSLSELVFFLLRFQASNNKDFLFTPLDSIDDRFS